LAELPNNNVEANATKPVAAAPETKGSERGSDTALEIAVFVGTLALAYFSGWRAKDLIWSLWLSSLAIGFLSVLVSGGRRIIRPDATMVERAFSVIGALGAIMVFSVHFGMFHYVYASILDLLMPLMDHPGRVYIGKLTWKGGTSFSFWETLGIAIVQYWPVVLLNVMRDRQSVLSSSVMTGKETAPYLVILKLHFLVMGLGACYGLGLDSFPVYAAVYTLLFSPAKLWKLVFKRKSEVREGGG
jgi:hypothetical protein